MKLGSEAITYYNMKLGDNWSQHMKFFSALFFLLFVLGSYCQLSDETLQVNRNRLKVILEQFCRYTLCQKNLLLKRGKNYRLHHRCA
jgi:hypothetical protein